MNELEELEDEWEELKSWEHFQDELERIKKKNRD